MAAVLRIQIRCFFDPGSGMGEKSGSGMNMNTDDVDPDPVFGIF
jgi:hypothetical protein